MSGQQMAKCVDSDVDIGAIVVRSACHSSWVRLPQRCRWLKDWRHRAGFRTGAIFLRSSLIGER